MLGRGRAAGAAGPVVYGPGGAARSPDGDEGGDKGQALDGGGGLHDVVAQVGAEGGGVLDRRHTVWVQWCANGALGGEGDAKRSGVGAHLLEEGSLGGRGPVGVAEVGPGGGVQEGGAIAHGAGEGVLADEACEHVPVVGAQGIAGAGGLEAEQAAAGGGDADGAAAVAAVGHGDDAGGHGGGGAAAGAAGGALGVPGVVGGAEEAGLGGRHEAELRGIGLAHDDQPGALLTNDELGVPG